MTREPSAPPWHAPLPAHRQGNEPPAPSVHGATIASLRRVTGPAGVGDYLATLEAMHGADYARAAHMASMPPLSEGA